MRDLTQQSQLHCNEPLLPTHDGQLHREVQRRRNKRNNVLNEFAIGCTYLSNRIHSRVNKKSLQIFKVCKLFVVGVSGKISNQLYSDLRLMSRLSKACDSRIIA